MLESFCRTLGMHYFCSYSVNSESSVSFLRQNFIHMPTVRWLDARSLACLSGAPHARLAPSWRRWHPGLPMPACFAAVEPPKRPTGSKTAAQRRSAPPKPPGGSAWPSPCHCTHAAPSSCLGTRRARSQPPTGRAAVPSSTLR